MLLVVTKRNVRHHRRSMEQAYRLRHRVFVEQLGWEALRRPDGREVDQFDTEDAIHLLMLEGDEVAGYSRLLPATGPTLLRDVYPHLAFLPAPSDPSTMEWTRYAIDPRWRGERAIDNVGSRLLCAVLAYAFQQGVERLSMQTDPIWIARFNDLGFAVDPLGLPTELDGAPVIAMTVALTKPGLDKCRRLLRLRDEPAIRDRSTPVAPPRLLQ